MSAHAELKQQLPCTVHVQGGASFVIPHAEDSLLRGALRAGLAFPYECNVGGCGACRFTLVEGEVVDHWPDAPGLSARERARGKYLACQSLPVGDCTIAVRLADDPPTRALQRRAVLTERRQLTADTARFSFSIEGDDAFRPGQYALLGVPGVNGPRAYSIANHRRGAGAWDFIIRQRPGGQATSWLFDRARTGDAIAIDGPYGHAYFREGLGGDVVCLAGGSGIGPMVTIAAEAMARDPQRRVHFLLGLRDAADLAIESVLEPLLGPRLELSTILSEPGAVAEGGRRTGLLHEHLETVLPPDLAALDYYMAGPPLMVNAVLGLLAKNNVPLGQVHFDRFL